MDINFFDIATTVAPSRGDLLLSEPFLPDPNFSRAVIYLCEHDHQGSFGYILNKPTDLNFDEVVDGVAGFKPPIMLGGPVQQETLHFLHRDFKTLKSGKEISNGVFWGGNFNTLLELIEVNAITDEDYKFFLGYSGWSEGQLMEEIKAKSWIVYKNAPLDFVFELSAESMWKEILKSMGGKYRIFANYPSDPRLN